MGQINLQSFFKETNQKIKPYIQEQCQNLLNYPIDNAKMIAFYIQEYTQKGKMIRASLLRLSALSFGKDNDDIYKIAAIIELAQSALLIHDDIIDDDDMRRGGKSMHKLLENEFTNSPNKKIGFSLAICMGDIILFHLFSQLPKNQEITSLFSQKLTQTALGQEMDVRYSLLNKEISKEDIFTIIKFKTTQYTFSLPLLSGSIICEKYNELKEPLEELSTLLGYIFQIRDDELNLLSSSQTGKSMGGDIRENKKTLCRYELLKDNPQLEEYFGSDDNILEIQNYYNLITTKKINNYIQKFTKKAQNIIQKLPINEKYKSLWEELLFYLINRQF